MARAARLGKTLGRRQHIEKPSKALTREQLATFLVAARRVVPRYAPVFLLLARTGLRMGEALALTWTDINEQARTIRVARGIAADGTVGTPKSGKARTVDISQQLLGELQRLHVERKRETLQRGWKELPAWMFVNQEGRRLNLRRVGECFAKALTAAKLPGHFIPHSLRHTYASLLLADGVSPVYVKEQLGHANIGMTVDLYGRRLPSSNHGAVDRLDERPGRYGRQQVDGGVLKRV